VTTLSGRPYVFMTRLRNFSAMFHGQEARTPVPGARVRSGHVHEGQHPPSVERDLWDRVQERLQEHVAAIGARRAHQLSDALLVGKLMIAAIG